MDLIGDYGSEGSTSDDDGELKQNKTKQKKLIEIINSEDVAIETFRRSVPHVAGNWAGHVFCTIPQQAWGEHMSDSVSRFQQFLQSTLRFEGGQMISHLDTEIHMSLSRSFTLQLSSVEFFVESLKKRLCHLPATTLRVNPSKEQILVNDERTRSFWTWPIDPNPTLVAIVEEINAVLRIYNQPPYYDPPVFHISLASVVGDLGDHTGLSARPKPKETGPTSFALPLTQVHCSFGAAKHYTIDLLDK